MNGRFFRPERLIILGGGHVGQAISKFASAVGFYVIVVDDRPSFANRSCFPDAEEIYCEEFEKALDMLQIGSNDYVTVVTRGHRFDLTCLRKVLKGIFPRYLGMMGSKRRVAGIIDLLQEEGNAAETVAKIHMPIGLNIGALTVPEIAISIVAELIEERRKGTPRRSHSQLLTCTDTDPRVIEMLGDPNVGKAMLLVYDTSGSTPVNRCTDDCQQQSAVSGNHRWRLYRKRSTAGSISHDRNRRNKTFYTGYEQRSSGRSGHGVWWPYVGIRSRSWLM